VSAVPFPSLPDTARLWILAAAEPVPGAEVPRILDHVDVFIRGWGSHKREVRAAREWKYDRFLLIGVDETQVALSGCSIDSMVRGMEEVGAALGITWDDASRVQFRDGIGIRSVTRGAFRELVGSREVDRETIVFNNVIGSVGALRRGRWEVPMRESWHARAFPAPDEAPAAS
jgi:hypothetical protein